jgi:EmrB/QacA subfamily drug resistance transporter
MSLMQCRASVPESGELPRRRRVSGPPRNPSENLNGASKANLMNARLTSVRCPLALPSPARPDSVAAIEASARQELANPWITFVLVAVGTFMIMLDTSIVNISLPSIAETFHTPVGGTIEWISIAYLMTIASTLLTFGRLSDMVGRRPVWLSGLALFTLGSGVCGAANSLSILIAARAFQGLGGALLLSTSVAIITDSFSYHKRGFALGCNAVVIALGSSAGPALGGFITEHWSWRWIFYVNLPIGICGFIGSQKVLRRALSTVRRRFDPFGMALIAAGFAPLTLALSFAPEWGWTSWRSLLCFGASLAALLALPAVERRVADPIIHLGLLRNPVFTSALICMTLAMLALFAVGFMLPFYLEELRGFSAARSGLFLTAMPLSLALMAPVSGALADRFGSRWLTSGGLAVACLGLVAIAQLDARSSAWSMIWPLILTGIGQGLFMTPNARALMNAAPANEQGTASGLLATGRVLGQSLSVAVAGAIFAGLGSAEAGRTLLEAKTNYSGVEGGINTMQLKFLNGFHIALLVCAGIAAAGILVALIRGSEMQPVVRAASKRGTRPVQNQNAMTEIPLKSSIAL